MTRIQHMNEAGCAWVLQQLSRYLDGELSTAASDRVHEHLEECADCQQAFHEEAELLTLTVDHLVAAEPAPDLELRLAVALAAEASRVTPIPTPRSPVLSTWASAAAAILFLAVGWLLFAGSTTLPTELDVVPVIIETASAETVDEPILVSGGDLDGDGDTGLRDVELFARYITEEGVSLPCERAADIDKDGALTISDVFAVTHQQMYATTELEVFGTPRADDRLPCDDVVACL